MTTFEGRTVLITGGGTGIGKGCAQYLLGRGGTVTIAGPDADVLESAAAELRIATGSDAVHALARGCSTRKKSTHSLPKRVWPNRRLGPS
jgi:NAD(P)-dependent dehydrogenase (short-subunit alcohol dehydrogenase family)